MSHRRASRQTACTKKTWHVAPVSAVAIVLLCASAMSCTHQGSDPVDDWADYLTRANDYLAEKQDAFVAVVDGYPRYFYDQGLGTIAFCDEAGPQVVGKMLVVGSTSRSSGTWLWSWDNETVLRSMSEPLGKVRRVGEVRGFPKLAEPHWPADETDAWEMAIVASYVLEADALYRSPDENGALFLLVFEPQVVSDASPPARCD